MKTRSINTSAVKIGLTDAVWFALNGPVIGNQKKN